MTSEPGRDAEDGAPFGALPPSERLVRQRHSAAHVLAEAVLEMFPGAKYAIGPPIEHGFYYDFELPRPLTPDDLAALEARMRETVAADLPIEGEWIAKDAARRVFAGQPYKLELIDEIEGETVGHFRHGAFEDLCRGGHVERTGQLGAFTLTHVAGAYWRGDERRPMLQRVYGALFPTPEELGAHLAAREEAERRDHRRLGRELDLFSTHEEYGPGLIYWHPKGARVRLEIEDFWRREHLAAGYELVYTPHTGRAALWERSGHLDFYAESMYAPMDVDGSDFYLKPMNCPFHIQIYRNALRSYRDLPMRLAELGTVYRYERSGTLHGMLRVRGFTQDDAHIVCTPEQAEDEIAGVVGLFLRVLGAFGFAGVRARLSTRPAEKYVGRIGDWERAEASLRAALARAGLEYAVDEGEGAFYGPKIDFDLVDALGRDWQCSTIQFDFNLPERFGMAYVGEDGREHRPFMIHRALYGSIERFTGILVEHYAGALPLWLAPVQAVVVPIADRHAAYAREVREALAARGLRAEADDGGGRMGARIRKAQLQKVPYMLVAGDREAAARTVSLRHRALGDLGAFPLADACERIARERDAKSPDPQPEGGAA